MGSQLKVADTGNIAEVGAGAEQRCELVLGIAIAHAGQELRCVLPDARRFKQIAGSADGAWQMAWRLSALQRFLRRQHVINVVFAIPQGPGGNLSRKLSRRWKSGSAPVWARAQ